MNISYMCLVMFCFCFCINNWSSSFFHFSHSFIDHYDEFEIVFICTSTLFFKSAFMLALALHTCTCQVYIDHKFTSNIECHVDRVHTGLTSSWIYRTVLKRPWKVLEFFHLLGDSAVIMKHHRTVWHVWQIFLRSDKSYLITGPTVLWDLSPKVTVLAEYIKILLF